jgi:NAD+ synthase
MTVSLHSDYLVLNYKHVTEEIVQFIRKVVRESRLNGAVVGMSGGIDSSVVATLCAKALGSDRVVGLLMPASHTPKADVDDARQLATSLGIRTYEVPIDTIFESFSERLADSLGITGGQIPKANLKARIRMSILYYYANIFSMLVAGTGDRSEDLIGYFTKYGDGGVDFLPIAHLYKTQVRALGAYLGLPDRIVSKPSSPQLWSGHLATDELPIGYEKLDIILHLLFDLHSPPDLVSKETGVDSKIIADVLDRYYRSSHKRSYPPMVRSW